jgi:hypothetical protein
VFGSQEVQNHIGYDNRSIVDIDSDAGVRCHLESIPSCDKFPIYFADLFHERFDGVVIV